MANKSIVAKFLSQLWPRKLASQDLMLRESAYGRQLFGPVPEGHSREFYCQDEQTWVWQESWQDEQGRLQTTTTKYEVYPDHIIKIQPNHPDQLVEDAEAQRLLLASRWYYQLVSQHVYGLNIQK